MKPIISKFNSVDNSEITTLRTIVLFGRNVSTYKFALVSSLLKLKPANEIKYQDLRDEFIDALWKHYEINPNQYQGGENNSTKAFDKFKIDGNRNELVRTLEPTIFNYVFDAFHNVGGGSIKKENILFENNSRQKKLVLTNSINAILEKKELTRLLNEENESRWRIVEEAWKNKLSPNLLVFDEIKSEFISISGEERTNLRSAVSVLLPYQHGRCFYCKKTINVTANSDEHNFPDVDHFVAHMNFKRTELNHLNPDGIWNLVIACKECNRGSGGKFERLPDANYQNDIITRNVLFTEEHRHSLKNSILLSLNAKNHFEVELKMHQIFNLFTIIEGWKPKLIYHYE